VERPGTVRLAFDQGTLVLHGLPGDQGGALERGVWAFDGRVPAWRCEALHYARQRSVLRERFGEALQDDVPTVAPVAWPALALPQLRGDQGEALAAWRDAGRRGQVIWPTGTGKTEIALAAMAEARVATLIVAPVRDLMYQWHRRILRGLGYDAGVLGDSRYDVRSVTVTTYESAWIHMAEIGARFGLVVFDEVHHLPGRCRREAALLCAAPWRLGLSATPERADGLHADLDQLVGPVVHRMKIAEVRGRTLADYQIVRIPVELNRDERQRYDEASHAVRAFIAERRLEKPDYDWKDLCKESGKNPEARRAQKAFFYKRSIEDRAEEKFRVLEDLFRLHAGERVLVFAGSNRMAIEVSRRFLVPVLLAPSRKKERHAVLDGFASGKFPVLVANQVLDEGVDVPAAKVAVVLGGLASTRQAKQRLGRILRRSGASQATLYEVVCEDTNEEERSRRRRRSDAFDRRIDRRL
jgi:superfamily II DNA or RNA helicase